MFKRLYIILLLAAFFASTGYATSKVYLIRTDDRAAALHSLLKQIDLTGLKGKKIVIKPNFNSDDPFPATTHLDTLKNAIKIVKANSPASITIIERSGMGNTEKILENRGVVALAKKEGIRLINLDKLERKSWVKKGEKGTHWLRGYLVPKVLLEADYVINLPCLKTHRFGGDFTMSLKNNVGAIAKKDGIYNYMWELHASPSQRLMIAEINNAIPCSLVVMDGLKAFADLGPDKGKLIEPGVMLLSTDRVAIDAVGVAILRSFGTTPKVSRGSIFELDQIKRAADLGIGARSAEEIELIPLDQASDKISDQIKLFLH